mmetsp:Transcript_10110/g.24337  ORF Transcript_10110/g.24337 Transcript_10110/m.24337 type:complete len:183 (+) Transcript_10110:794-1342(+)
MERIHSDLNVRLEIETRERFLLEAKLEQRERDWAEQFDQIAKDRDYWKSEVKTEQAKYARLVDQVTRKDQGLHRMLQRKYDMQRNDTGVAAAAQSSSIRAVRNSTSERPATPPRQEQQHHPHFQYHNQTHQQQQNPSISKMAGSSSSIRELKSPYQLLAESGSMETVRQRNVKNLLGDFFSM